MLSSVVRANDAHKSRNAFRTWIGESLGVNMARLESLWHLKEWAVACIDEITSRKKEVATLRNIREITCGPTLSRAIGTTQPYERRDEKTNEDGSLSFSFITPPELAEQISQQASDSDVHHPPKIAINQQERRTYSRKDKEENHNQHHAKWTQSALLALVIL
jgi:hypothetical protein